MNGGPELEALLSAQCRLTLRRGDARFVRQAYRAAAIGDAAALRECARTDLAARVALVQRRATLTLGRNLLRLARTIATSEEAAAIDAVASALERATPRASVFGAIARALGIDDARAVEGYVYSALSNAIAAAVRLALIPPLEGQTVLRRLLVADHDWPGDDWSLFSPLLDVAAMHHESVTGRLFAS